MCVCMCDNAGLQDMLREVLQIGCIAVISSIPPSVACVFLKFGFSSGLWPFPLSSAGLLEANTRQRKFLRVLVQDHTKHSGFPSAVALKHLRHLRCI